MEPAFVVRQGMPRLHRDLRRDASGVRGVLLIGSRLFKLASSWLAGVFAATAASWAMRGPRWVLERMQAFRKLLSAQAASPA